MVVIRPEDLITSNTSGTVSHQELCREPGVHKNIRKQQIMQVEVPINKAKYSINPKEIYSYLRIKGLSNIHSIGIINNLHYESGFKSDVVKNIDNPNGIGSGGLFLHSGEVFDLMYCQTGDGWRKNWKGQIDFMLTESRTKKYLSTTFQTEEEASIWFTEYWIKPQNPKLESQKRLSSIHHYKSFQETYP